MDDETEALENAPVYRSPTEKIVDGDEKRLNNSNDQVGLKANINLFGGVMVVVGCIIGSGIFVSPTGVHANAGSLGLSLIIWTFCGVFSMFGAYCYAELGTFITKSGGDYAYVYAAFGPFIAFIRMWVECIIVRPCTMTTVAMTFATYILRPFFATCGDPPATPQLLAAGCLILLTLVNMLSVNVAKQVQNIFTIGKLLALVLIIFTGILLLCVGGSKRSCFVLIDRFGADEYVEPFQRAFDGTTSSPGKIALAFYSGLWAYNGWNYLNFVTEELKDPVKNLPRAIVISCTICAVVYTLTNVAFYAGVTERELLDSSAVAVAFANRFYGVMAWTMPVFVAMSCFGTVNGVLMTSSRLFYVAARENHMPTVFSFISPRYSTPMPAVIITGSLSLLYLFLSSNIYTLISYVQIVNWLAIGVATAGLIYLRYKMPPEQFHRPLKVNLFFPIVFLIGCVFLVVFPIIQSPVDTFIGLGIMLTSIPVYLVFISWSTKPRSFTEAIHKATLDIQKLMLVVPPKID